MANYDHNNPLALPGNTPTEKLKSAAGRLEMILKDRRYVRSSLSDLLKNEKEKGRDPGELRAAIRFDNLSPEKRKAWEERHARAAALFGIRIEYTGEEQPLDREQWGAVLIARGIADEVRKIDERKKELRDACKLAEIDFRALEQVVKLKIRNEEHEDAADRQERVDAYGVAIGLW